MSEKRAIWILLVALGSGCGTGAKGQAPAESPEGGSAAPPSSPEARGPLPGSEFALRDAPSSGESAENRPKLSPEAARPYAIGLTAFRSGDLGTAQREFQKAVVADPRGYQAYYSLGAVKERLDDLGGAEAAYQKSVEIVTDYEPAIVAYALLLARTDRAAQGEQYLSAKVAAFPKSAALPAALSEITSMRGDSGEAQRLAQEALKKNPGYRPAMLAIARDHYRTRRLDLALYALRGILDGYGVENPPRDKNSAEARLLRGLIYKDQEARAAAIDELRKAVEIRPDLVEARVQLGALLLESGNASEAATLLEDATRFDPDHVIARLNLGDAYRVLGKAGEAKRELEWVAQKDPSLYQVHYDLGLLYLFSKSVPGATPVQAAERAITELEAYKKTRSRKPGPGDDTDELITRAKAKKSLLEAEREEAKAQKGAEP